MSSAAPGEVSAATGEHGFYIPSLDGVRAVAFLVVFVAHAGLGDIVPGGFGVTVFFFLSGYLITTLLRREFDRKGGVDLKAFYVRRTFRISPPYYVVLAVVVLTAVPSDVDPGMLWAQVLYLSNIAIAARNSYEGMVPGTGVYWSVAVEEHFYLFFPLLYLGLRRGFRSRRQQTLILAAISALVLVWRCILVFGLEAPMLRTYLATDARMDSILFGCILAVAYNPMIDVELLEEPKLLRIGVPLGLAVLAFTFLYRDPAFRETLRYTLQGLALVPLFIAIIRYPDAPGIRLLNTRGLRYLGVLSYSLYLVHHVILDRLGPWGLPLVMRGAVALALSVAAAVVVREAVEKPAINARRWVLQRTRGVPVRST